MCLIGTSNVVKFEEQLYGVERWAAPFDTYNASQDFTIILFVFFYMHPMVIVSTLYSCFLQENIHNYEAFQVYIIILFVFFYTYPMIIVSTLYSGVIYKRKEGLLQTP